jgi:hypothetical protein
MIEIPRTVSLVQTSMELPHSDRKERAPLGDDEKLHRVKSGEI